MGRKVLVLVFVASLVFSMCSFASAADKVISLKFANYFPPTHMNGVMMGKFCEELNKRLAGKVEITYLVGGTLLKAPQTAAGIADGIADIGLAHCGYSRGRFPVTEVMELPLGLPSGWVGTHVANDLWEKFKPKEWDAYHPLMFATCGPNILQTLKKPVTKLSQLKGLKLRGTGRVGDLIKALGATPMPVEMVDLYESLRRGVIDGTYNPLETLKGFKLGEVEKYATASWKVGNAYTFYVAMNKKKWDSLPEDAQKTIDDFSKEFIERWAVEWNTIDIEGREWFLKQGGQILELSDSEHEKWVKAAAPVVDAYKADLVSKGFQASDVDAMLKFVKARLQYWTAQEKARKIPTAYKY
ncbi:MAG: hypothetical protein A2169_14070 [Deltaproteobacteria bacterium RBG_13_47_9]|nr:MAG: hypothetical protein A2169_14070 [Deltaproteobacteria bacterium RBG_13_47_9]